MSSWYGNLSGVTNVCWRYGYRKADDGDISTLSKK